MLLETFKHNQGFSEIIIDRKKKFSVRKVDKENSTTVFAPIAITSDFIK